MNELFLQIRSQWKHPPVAVMVFRCNDSLSCKRPAHVGFKVTLVRQDLPVCLRFFSFLLGPPYACSATTHMRTHSPSISYKTVGEVANLESRYWKLETDPFPAGSLLPFSSLSLLVRKMFSGRALLPVITPLYTSHWWRERQWGRGRPGFTQSTTENSAQNVRHAFLSASGHTHMQHSIKAAANVTAVYACLMWDSNDIGWWELQLQNEFSYVWSQKDNTPTHTHT